VRARGARADSPPNEAEHEESSSFLKKRTKKLLSISRTPARMGELTNRAKVFVSFFQKRNPSLLRWHVSPYGGWLRYQNIHENAANRKPLSSGYDSITD
jgi:hypothetical protein